MPGKMKIMIQNNEKSFRDGQNFFILRRGEIPSVRNQNGSYVCDYPQEMLYNDSFLYDVCHLNNDQEVIDYIFSYKARNVN